ncbi:MAG: NAD(P)-dependent oxidoreductase [Bacteroidia bacterium]
MKGCKRSNAKSGINIGEMEKNVFSLRVFPTYCKKSQGSVNNIIFNNENQVDMNILIFGASGKTGHELVKQALQQGHAVTAFVRTPSKLKVQHRDLKVVQGDVTDAFSVQNAINGNDVVLSTLGAKSPFKFDQSVVDGVGNIIKAMEQNNVSRFIYMSFVGVKETHGNAGFVIKYIAPKLLSTEIAGHEARESMIKLCKLNWTIVRPPTLTNGKHIAQFRSGEDITSKGFTVTFSRADVADFMLRQLTDNTFLRKAPIIMY